MYIFLKKIRSSQDFSLRIIAISNEEEKLLADEWEDHSNVRYKLFVKGIQEKKREPNFVFSAYNNDHGK